MAGVGAASSITNGVIPCAARISAAMEQNVSPRNRGSRPTITRAPDGFCELTYRAIPVTARRTLANVNSSATIARHPEVPNLICAGMVQFDVRIFQDVTSLYVKPPVPIDLRA